MALNSNPDRRQRFIEAFSDALVDAVNKGDKTKLMFGVADVPLLVAKKITAIEKEPRRFDIEGAAMGATCRYLNISCSRDAVIAFLTISEPPAVEMPLKEMPAALVEKIQKLSEGVADEQLYLAVLRGDFPDWKIDLTPEGIEVVPI